MNIRKILAALFVVSFGAAPVFAQSCPHGHDRRPARELVVVAPSTYGNPCAPYAWCGPRDAWGNPVYTVPGYTAYPDAYGYGTVVYETVQPRVNGWTGAVEYRQPNPYGGLIAY